MARAKSEEKRNAILAAATQAVAEDGIGAPTAKIAKLAGVAEGSVFVYFETKDVLFNELYLDIKNHLLAAMMDGYPRNSADREKFHHVWRTNCRWGVANPLKRKAMAQLSVSERVTTENKVLGAQLFDEVFEALKATVVRKSLKAVSIEYAGAIFGTLAEATMDFMAKSPALANDYEAAGFDAAWNALNGS